MVFNKKNGVSERAVKCWNDLEKAVLTNLPPSYQSFILDFDSLYCYCLVDPVPKIEELKPYFEDELVVEELFNLDAMQSLYFDELFFNIEIVNFTKILFIGTFIGGRNLIGIGFGEHNRDQVYFVDADLFPDDVSQMHLTPNFAISMNISFLNFIQRFKCIDE